MIDLDKLHRHQITSKHLQVEVLAEAGLRVIALRLSGSGENLLAESPNNHWPTPYGEYHLLGGHRLWTAPEIPAQTYAPDGDEIQVAETENGLLATAPTSPVTGLQKSIHVQIPPTLPQVVLTHRIVNHGEAPIQIAAWAITALPLGGTVFLPQPAGPAESFQPDRLLVFWPYTSLTDARLHIADSMITLHAKPSLPPCKIGHFNAHGWMCYRHAGLVLVKRFDVHAGQPHADYGCNAEVYCNDRLVELETLSPLKSVQPGESIEHIERWEIYPTDSLPRELAALSAG